MRIQKSCTTCGWRRAACVPRSLFSGVLPVRAQVFREELGWLGRLLGTVRDLDVQLEGLAEDADATAGWSADARPEDHDPLEELSALLQRERDAARAAMLSGLDSVRWERLTRGLAAMVQQGPARRLVATRTPAVIGMPDLIVERHTAVSKAARRAKKSGLVGDFHRVRIRCKRLRYALEFSAEVYGGRTSRYVRQLTALQDELGLMQDAEVASIRLADLATGAGDLPPATVFVMGGIAERHRRDVDRLLHRLPNQLKRVRGREWRNLLDVMERRRNAAEAARPPLRSTLRAVPVPPDQQAEPPERPDAAGPGAPASPASSLSPVAPVTSVTPVTPVTPATPTGSISPDHPAAVPGLSALAPPPQSGKGE